jgi:hypothetical protein
MKRGLIVYLLGGGELPEGCEAGAHCQVMGQPAGHMEIVISQPGFLELDDAWHFLLTEGCEIIHLLVAQAEQNYLQPLYPLVPLTGVTRLGPGPSGACANRRVLQ